MYPTTGLYRQNVAQSHTMNARIDVLHSGRKVYELVPHDGSVSMQAGRSVMSNLNATVIDPTGQLSGGDINDLLSPYTCEVQPWRAVVVPGTTEINPSTGSLTLVTGYTEWVPLGVYRLTQRHPMGDGRVELTGQDRAQGYQGGMAGSLAISGGSTIESAISQLLITRNQSLRWSGAVTGFTSGPLLFGPDINVWTEAQKLAGSVGKYLYHDRNGFLQLGPLAAPTTLTAVDRYGDGDGLLITADRTESADTIANVVVVQSSAAGTGGVVTATAADTDPTSPTYYKGSYGEHVVVITNPYVTTTQQALQAATAQLVLNLGRSQSVTATTVCNPALDVCDVVIVNRPIVGLIEKALLVDQIQIPLTASELTQLTFRNYILTEDGQTVQTTLPVVSS